MNELAIERYVSHGTYITTHRGDVVKRPRVLPQHRYRVATADGLHFRAYVRAGVVWRLVHGRQWHCISGKRTWVDELDVWEWLGDWCVHALNPLRASDWHGLGYARWKQVLLAHLRGANPFAGDPWLQHIVTEPSWISDLYRNGPPDWGSM